MKSNLLLKLGAVLLTIIVGSLLVIGGKSDDAVQEAAGTGSVETDLMAIEAGPAEEDNGLTNEFLSDQYLEEEYAVSVDSPVETMRTLTNETRAVREDSVQLQEENKKLQQSVDLLLRMEDQVNQRVDGNFAVQKKEAEERALNAKRAEERTQSMLKQLQERMNLLQADQGKDDKKRGQPTAGGFDINGAEIPSGFGFDESGAPVNYDEVVWVNPADASVDKTDPTKLSVPDFTAAKETIADIADRGRSDQDLKEERLIKAYTIPANATLLGSVSMTALLGRIPVGGQVSDPYPFKIIIGEENLSSNGINIPGVNGIKMSGLAKGDWTLSCVSGQISSMTFTFQDGTILNIPDGDNQGGEPIAWFSDKNGIPCVTGKRITNAVSYLASRVGLTTASGYANALAQAEQTTSSNAYGGSTTSVTGDPNTLAQNTAISEGINEVTDWLDARQSNSFDAIYVEPGTQLAVHILKELQIDYDPEGRKVNHYAEIQSRSAYYLD